MLSQIKFGSVAVLFFDWSVDFGNLRFYYSLASSLGRAVSSVCLGCSSGELDSNAVMVSRAGYCGTGNESGRCFLAESFLAFRFASFFLALAPAQSVPPPQSGTATSGRRGITSPVPFLLEFILPSKDIFIPFR
jgi:hypothetical protein